MEAGAAVEPTDPGQGENRHGGFYELSIKLGDHDDLRLEVALRSLWQAAGLSRPFRRPTVGTTEPPGVTAASLLAGSLGAVATIPEMGSSLCSVMLVREETYVDGDTVFGADWLDLCLPLGSLANLDPRVGAYPFEASGSREWRTPIERWFEHIGRAVFAANPYAHAVTGFEVSGTEAAEARGGWIGLLAPTAAGDLGVSPIRNW